MVKDTIKKCSKFFNIKCNVDELPFHSYRDLVHRERGVYVLTTGIDLDAEVVYVGKGFARTRQKSHWMKANDPLETMPYIPKGWKWLRETYEVRPMDWHLYYIKLNKETELSAMEGALIHLLQPLANDETFKDRELENG